MTEGIQTLDIDDKDRALKKKKKKKKQKAVIGGNRSKEALIPSGSTATQKQQNTGNSRNITIPTPAKSSSDRTPSVEKPLNGTREKPASNGASGYTVSNEGSSNAKQHNAERTGQTNAMNINMEPFIHPVTKEKYDIANGDTPGLRLLRAKLISMNRQVVERLREEKFPGSTEELQLAAHNIITKVLWNPERIGQQKGVAVMHPSVEYQQNRAKLESQTGGTTTSKHHKEPVLQNGPTGHPKVTRDSQGNVTLLRQSKQSGKSSFLKKNGNGKSNNHLEQSFNRRIQCTAKYEVSNRKCVSFRVD